MNRGHIVDQSHFPVLPKYHDALIRLISRLPDTVGVYALRAFNLYLRNQRANFLVTTKHGFQMLCSTSDLIPLYIIQFGHWEPEVSALMEALVGPGETVADIGANIGYDTLLMSGLVGPSGRVVGIEASASTFGLLKQNLSLNRSSNIRAINLAVSNEPGELTLYQRSATNTGQATTVKSKGVVEECTVQALPLHTALDRQEQESLRFIKMDVEGAEYPIVASILENLHAFPRLDSLLIEISDVDNPGWASVFAAFSRNGFQAYAIENEYSYLSYLKWKQPAPLRRIAAAPDRQTDVLFTRRDLPDTLSVIQ